MIPVLLIAFTCLPVDGPKLLARHVAPGVPDFRQLAPDTDLGYAPVPGVVRVMRADDVRRLAAKHGVTATPGPEGLCFEWPMKTLQEADVLRAMKSALPSEARIEVLELSRTPTPEGTLEFPFEKLQGSIWRGVIRYGNAGRFEVWARVRVQMKQTRVITLAPLQSGDTIQASQLRLEEFEDAPVSGLIPSIVAAAGMASKRVLPAGTVLKAEFLDKPTAVARGDTVRLRVTVGDAHVITDASAQAPGKVGDVIPVKNMASGRVLRARVEGPGQVRLTQ